MSSSSLKNVTSFLERAISDNNMLGLSEDEIVNMSAEVIKSRRKKEIFDWCLTLLLPEHVGGALVTRLREAGVTFDDDDPPLAQPEVQQKKGRQLKVKSKRCDIEKWKEKKGKNAGADLKPGEMECGCFATIHKLGGNCLNCGRIYCEQEGGSMCYYCGLEPSRCVAYEVAVQEGRITEAACAKDKELYEEAVKQRDCLLEYAKNKAKRTEVIDDQMASLFGPQNAWISPEERKQVEKSAVEEERRKRIEEMHRHKGAYTVHLDFVNRNVSLGALPLPAPTASKPAPERKGEEEDDDDSDDGLWNQTIEDGAVAFPELPQIWYSPEGTRVVDSIKGKGSCGPSQAAESKLNGVARTVQSKRVQQDYFEEDNEAFQQGLELASRLHEVAPPIGEKKDGESGAPSESYELKPSVDGGYTIPYGMRQVDEGVCLSMHQPWASLLVHGIKTHEGRTWETPYRGKLWIHAAAHQPADCSEIEEHYRSYLPVGGSFPAHYPTKVLLGYVFVVDCLDKESYDAQYTEPERREDSPFTFICVEPKALLFPLPMVGQHKLFTLENKIHTAAKKQLGEIAM